MKKLILMILSIAILSTHVSALKINALQDENVSVPQNTQNERSKNDIDSEREVGKNTNKEAKISVEGHNENATNKAEAGSQDSQLATPKPVEKSQDVKVETPKSVESSQDALGIGENPVQTKALVNRMYPESLVSDVDHIKEINQSLRTKYMNRGEYYSEYYDSSDTDTSDTNSIENLDNTFNVKLKHKMILYANLTPGDFNINENFLKNSPDKVFDSYFKDSVYGIDHGYFLGNLVKKPQDFSKNELIQMKVIIPKGSDVTRVGSLEDAQFILPRNSTFKYTYQGFDRSTNTVNLSAELIDGEELKAVTKEKEIEINTKMHDLYGTSDQLFHLVPIGLNAGMVLKDSLNIVSNVFKRLADYGLFSKYSFDHLKIYLTNGWLVHTDLLAKFGSRPLSSAFERLFNSRLVGSTSSNILSPEDNDTTITFAHLYYPEALPHISTTDKIESTLTHEIFHYLMNVTSRFQNVPRYGKDANNFIQHAKNLKSSENGQLMQMLNNRYSDEDWNEFTCEAFSAKFHPDEDLRNRFKKELPKTNRMFDSLFDATPPTAPTNLKVLEVNGTSAKMTFNHAKDNLGVDQYHIYQNGVLVKSVPLQKDADGLAYPDPEAHQANMEIVVDNLQQFTDYEFQVTAVDEAGYESAKSAVLSVKTTDTEPPELTGNLSGQALASTLAMFTWPQPTDNQEVKEVEIRKREGGLLKRSAAKQKVETFTIPANTNYFVDNNIKAGKSYIYDMVAIDTSGNRSKLSNEVTIKTSEKDDEKKNKERAQNTKYSNTTLNWTGAFGSIASSGWRIFGFVSRIGGWVASGVTSVGGTITSSVVNLKPGGGTHKFVVVPVDKNNKPVAEGIEITVDPVDSSSITPQDSVIYEGQQWNAQDNVVSITDEDGNSVALNDPRITIEKVDVSKVGTYEITYIYKGIAKTTKSTTKVTVLKNKSSIKTKDKVLFVGQKWNSSDNFESATDEAGNVIPFNDPRITTNGVKVDVSKTGVYKFTYSYKGLSKTIDSTFKVSVIKDKSSIKASDQILTNYPYKYNLANNLDSATDEYGNPIVFSDPRITLEGDISNVNKPGVHYFKFIYNGVFKKSVAEFKVGMNFTNKFTDGVKKEHKLKYELSRWENIEYYRNIVFENISQSTVDQLDKYSVTYHNNDGSTGEYFIKPIVKQSKRGLYTIKVSFPNYGIEMSTLKYFEVYAHFKNGNFVRVFDYDHTNYYRDPNEYTDY